MKRRLNDIEKIREGMFERAKRSVNDLFPITNEAGRLEVENLHYRGDPPSKSDEKKALHRNESIGWDLRGDMVLRDAEGNEIDRRSRRIARIPYMTGRGTFIYNGNDYAIANQAKLKPGVYTRISRSGKMQAPIQTEGGPNMKLELDPGSGEMRLRMHQASLKLYPLLRASGMDDEQIRSYIGDAALEANKSSMDTRAESRVAEKITGDRNLDNLGERLRETLSGYGLDPGITEHTIGTAHENMSPEMLAETAGELTRLLKGESDPSPRDALYAQRVRSPEIQLDDQIQSGRYKLARRLWKAINKGSLDAVPAGVLDDRVNGLFFETGLASPLEEYNPLEAHDQMQRITRGGTGGLSGHAVPEESRYIHPTQLGFIDPVRTPESGNIGLDMRSAIDTYVDDDGELYTIMENAKTGETETVAAKDLKDLTVSWPDQKDQKTPVAVKKGRKIGLANSEDVDYYIPSGEQQHSDMTTLSPMLGTAHVGRGLMSGKFALQALPLATREEPLVQAAEEAGDGTIEQRLGRYAGAEHAPASGTVREVADDRIVIETPEGDTREVELYRDFPLNRKTSLHQEPAVQAGDAVEAGDLVATSNFTDPTGKVSLGANLRTAFLPSGKTFEDAVAIRAGAARDKLKARLMKTKEVSTEGKTEAGKGQYLSSFPQKYEKTQLDKIGDEGTVQVGETVQPGDPLILATGSPEKDPYYYSLRKTSPKSTDRSVEWDQDTEGKVIDVVHTDSGPKVYVETEKGAIQGDKLGTRFGGKGIMTVIPDDEMPRDKDGNPVDLLISPLATTSRKNPGLAEEAMLGKLARHRGKPVSMDLLSKSDDEESVNATAKGMLREEGLSPEEDLVDPKTGKTIKNVLTGDIYGYRLTHTAKGKGKARSLAGHTASGLPSTGGESGGKKISRQPLNALLSHGALDVIEESQKLKGASNPEVWDELRAGKDIKMPDIPYANRKLFDLLKGAGVNVKRKNNNLHIMPLRDSEVEEMSNGEITSSDMLDRKTMRPKPGSEGLFDPAITGGPGGDMWSHLELPYAIPNPTMERPIARLLEIPQKGVREVMAGEREIGGKTGPEALQEALRGLDVDRQMRNLKSSLPSMSKTARDRATKRLRHLRMLDRYDIKPEEMMITKVPVLPPKARPISDLPGLDAPVMESSNMLYKDLIDLKNAIAETDLPEEEMGQYRGELYDAAKSVYGLGDPVSRASQEKGLTGILKTVFGDSPKHSYLQSNVASKPQNLSGLSVISPSNDLSINEVGMPRSLAREAYEPLIVRKMVKQGMTPVAAMRELKNESPRAEKALKEAVEERPVIVNRAPTLHRGGMVALWPRLHDGETLEVSPPLVDTAGGDFDGDSGRFVVEIGISLTGGECLEYDGHAIKWNSFKGRQISMPVSNDDGVASARGPVCIDDLPVDEDSREELEDGTVVYDVPDGVSVVSIDTDTGEHSWMPVTRLTVHPDLRMRNVTIGTRTTSTVNVSEDDSLIVYDEGDIRPCKPDEAVGMVVPQVKGSGDGDGRFIELAGRYFGHIEGMDAPLNEDVGFVFGLMAGNGWVDTANMTYISNSRPSVFERFREIDDLPHGAKDTEYSRVNINGDRKKAGRIQVGFPAWLSRAMAQWFGDGADEKRLPSECFFGPQDHMLGILDGLWSSDGSVAINRSKSKPQLQVNYSTTSPYLKDQIIYLCRLLGVNATSTDAVNDAGTEYYVVSLSTVDVKRLVEDCGWSITADDKQKKLEEGLQYVDPTSTSAASMDLVPYPVHLHQVFLDINRSEDLVTRSGPSAKKNKGYVSREWAERFLPHMKKIDDDRVQDYCRIVENRTVTWKPVQDVQDAGVATAYDITVPDTWTFANLEGIFMQDTMLFHVPVTDEAVEDATEKMLPTRNLINPRRGESVYNPTKELAMGLWLATRETDEEKPAQEFTSRKKAIQAMRKGEIDPDQPVRILGSATHG